MGQRAREATLLQPPPPRPTTGSPGHHPAPAQSNQSGRQDPLPSAISLRAWAHTPPAICTPENTGGGTPPERWPLALTGALVTRDPDDGGPRLLLPRDTQESRTAVRPPLFF